MPTATPDWPVKTYVTLYGSLQKQIAGISLKAAEEKKLDSDLETYMENHWREVYGDNGTLQRMKELEASKTSDSPAILQKNKRFLESRYG